MGCEKIFANRLSDKDLVSRIRREFSELNVRKTSLSKLNIASRQGNGDAAQGDTRYALRASLSRASRQQVLAGKWGRRTPRHGLWGVEWCRRCGDGRVAALTVVRTAGSPSVCHRMMSEVLRPHGDVAQSSGSKAVRSPCVGLEDVMPSELRKSRKDTLRLPWTGRPGVADAQRQSRRRASSAVVSTRPSGSAVRLRPAAQEACSHGRLTSSEFIRRSSPSRRRREPRVPPPTARRAGWSPHPAARSTTPAQ